MSRVSPTWSPWPWVSTMWETPFIAAALSEMNAGFPVKNGSIRTAWPEKSRRNAEWPYQVICMELVRCCVGGSGRIDLEPGRSTASFVAVLGAYASSSFLKFESYSSCVVDLIGPRVNDGV